MSLTKEDFKQIETIVRKQVTKIVETTEQRIVKRIDESQEELARMVKNGFDDVMERLDVIERVEKLEKDMTKIKTTLLIH